jgi:hypothetical protein
MPIIPIGMATSRQQIWPSFTKSRPDHGFVSRLRVSPALRSNVHLGFSFQTKRIPESPLPRRTPRCRRASDCLPAPGGSSIRRPCAAESSLPDKDTERAWVCLNSLRQLSTLRAGSSKLICAILARPRTGMNTETEKFWSLD